MPGYAVKRKASSQSSAARTRWARLRKTVTHGYWLRSRLGKYGVRRTGRSYWSGQPRAVLRTKSQLKVKPGPVATDPMESFLSRDRPSNAMGIWSLLQSPGGLTPSSALNEIPSMNALSTAYKLPVSSRQSGLPYTWQSYYVGQCHLLRSMPFQTQDAQLMAQRFRLAKPLYNRIEIEPTMRLPVAVKMTLDHSSTGADYDDDAQVMDQPRVLIAQIQGENFPLFSTALNRYRNAVYLMYNAGSYPDGAQACLRQAQQCFHEFWNIAKTASGGYFREIDTSPGRVANPTVNMSFTHKSIPTNSGQVYYGDQTNLGGQGQVNVTPTFTTHLPYFIASGNDAKLITTAQSLQMAPMTCVLVEPSCTQYYGAAFSTIQNWTIDVPPATSLPFTNYETVRWKSPIIPYLTAFSTPATYYSNAGAPYDPDVAKTTVAADILPNIIDYPTGRAVVP